MEPAGASLAALRRRPDAAVAPLRPAGSEREALLRVAAAAAGAHHLEEVLELAAEEARAAIGAASLSVSRWERDGGALRTLINVGELGPGEERFPSAEVYPLGDDRGAQRLLTDGLAFFNSIDTPGVDLVSAARLRRLGKESEVGVPILVESEPWGEVYATTAPGQPHFRGEDVRFLEAVAGQLAVAIGRAELFSRVSRLAYEDPLTGLANRRALEERLERAVARATGRGGRLAVVLCDVDELKAINDDQGHDGGDRALRRVGEALVAAAATRPGNLVGRLSGDEFCVVMEGATLEDARALAALTLSALVEEAGPSILVSSGAAALGPAVATPPQLLRAADAALYRAKRNGGGQIFTAGVRAPEPPPRSDRRALRRSTEDRLRAAVQELTDRFEGELAAAAPLERIEAVGSALAEPLNAAGWAVSFARADADVIRTISQADGRDGRLEGLRLALHNDVYPVAEFPATARLFAAGAGAFVARADDEHADPAERALLRRYERLAVLAAAAADHDGFWLLEVYADDRTAPLEEALLDARLLMRAAVPPPLAGAHGETLLRHRTRQLQLITALGARLAGETRPQAMIDATLGALHDAMGAQASAVVRLREDGLMEMAAAAGAFDDPAVAGFTQAADRGLIGRCLREGRVVLALDVTREPDYAITPVTSDVRCELDAPLEIDGQPWGAISSQATEQGAFDEEDARLLGVVAEQLGASLGRTYG